MRMRSLWSTLVLALVALGLAGCGSSSSDAGKYVFNGYTEQPTTGSLTFQFATAQQSFTVDAGTTKLRFEFFDHASATGDLVFTYDADFAPSITIDNVPTSTQSVKITGFQADGSPIVEFVQALGVAGGETTIVSATATPVPVTLSNLALYVADGSGGVTGQILSLEVGGQAQLYLKAEYSNGMVVQHTKDAQFEVVSGGNYASVSSLGIVSGLQSNGSNAGQATIEASYAGQVFSKDVLVFDGLSNLLFDIVPVYPVGAFNYEVTIPSPSTVLTQQIQVKGIRYSNEHEELYLAPSNSRLHYTVTQVLDPTAAPTPPGGIFEPPFSSPRQVTVDGNGLVTLPVGFPAGQTISVQVTYDNPDGQTLTTIAFIETVSPAP